MSVVVRMEIPESCFVCPFRLGCSTYSAYSFSTSTRRALPKPLDEGCNILAVLPEGHGRLGDLDRLANMVNGARIEAMQKGYDTNPYWLLGDIIAQAETIVPADTAERSEKDGK